MNLLMIKTIFIGITGIISTGIFGIMLNYCLKNGHHDGSYGCGLGVIISLAISAFAIYSIGVTF